MASRYSSGGELLYLYAAVYYATLQGSLSPRRVCTIDKNCDSINLWGMATTLFSIIATTTVAEHTSSSIGCLLLAGQMNMGAWQDVIMVDVLLRHPGTDRQTDP